MTFLAGFIVIVVKVSSILIGCVHLAPANRSQCQPGRVGVGKIREPAGLSAALQWKEGRGKGRGFSYLLESLHMTYLAGSHVPRSWPGIQLMGQHSCKYIQRWLSNTFYQLLQREISPLIKRDANVADPSEELSDGLSVRSSSLIQLFKQFKDPLTSCNKFWRGVPVTSETFAFPH